MKKHAYIIRIICTVCIMAMLLGMCACTGDVQTEQPIQTPTGTQTIPEVEPTAKPDIGSTDAAGAEEIIAAFTGEAMEGRVVGSNGNHKAAEYIADYFEAIGLEPMFDDYLMEYDDEVIDTSAQPEVTLIAADGSETPLVLGVDYNATAAFADIDIQAPLSQDAAECAEGKAIFFSNDSNEAIEYARNDASRVAIYNSFNSNGTFLHRVRSMRGLQIGLLNGKAYSKLRDAAQVRIHAKQSASDGTAWNVVGRIKGSDSSQAFVVMAHFDGSGIMGEVLFPSAHDNASGTTTMMRAAAYYAASGVTPAQDIIFVATNGEESGKGGANAFNTYISAKYEKVNGINIDCIGRAGRDFIDVYTDSEMPGANPLANAMVELGSEVNARERCEEYSGDNRSFDAGACITLADCETELDDPVLHHAIDKAENLDRERIEAAAKLVAEFLTEYDGKLFDKTEPEEIPAGGGRNTAAKWESVVAQYNLAEDEFVLLKEGKWDANFYFGRKINEPNAIMKMFPGVNIPDKIGDYEFDSLTTYSSWMADGVAEGTYVGDNISFEGRHFPANTFETGKAYPASAMFDMGLLSVNFGIEYKAGDKGIRADYLVSSESESANEVTPEMDAGKVLNDDMLSGIELHFDGDVCYGGYYSIEGASVLVMMLGGVSMEQAAEILRALDIKGAVEAMM